MNYEKTGKLIAEKRKKLSLTQKELADRLNISDRTVSKWERGAGLPDISLIESVADELEISVLELLHGEEEELTEREKIMVKRTLDKIEPEVKSKIKKLKMLVAALIGIVAALLVIFLNFRSNIDNGKWVDMKEVTLSEAVYVMQDIVLNKGDYELIEEIKKDDMVKRFIEGGNEEILTVDIDYDYYSKKVDIPDEKIDFFIVRADKKLVFITYGGDYINYTLSEEADGSIVKNITKYSEPYRAEEGSVPDENRKVLYHLENTDNEFFSIRVSEKNI